MRTALARVAFASTLLLAAAATAQEGPAPVAAAPPAATRPPARLFLHVSFGFNVYTHLGATATSPATDITPADKAMIFQQVGVGYWVHPNLRLQLTFMFGETLTGLKAGASPFTQLAAIPCLVFTWRGLFVGAGPLLAPLALGSWDLHVGLYTVAGYAFPLGHGFTLAVAAQGPLLFLQRLSAAVTPALVLGYRF